MSRSDRLSSTLLACSMTPRSGKRYLEELAEAKARVDAQNERMYAEAKWSLLNGDVDSARVLLATCPSSYKRVGRYSRQCEEYDRLREEGVITSRKSGDVRSYLSDLLGEEESSLEVAKYADRLSKGGYNKKSLEAVTLLKAEAVSDLASFSQGHKDLFLLHVDKESPLWERVFVHSVRVLEKCGGVVKCFHSVKAEMDQREEWGKEARKRRAFLPDEDETANAEEEEETMGD